MHERISNLKDELLAELKEMRKEQAHINKELEKRVTVLERWKWTFMGGGAVLMFFLMGGQSFLQIFFQ